MIQDDENTRISRYDMASEYCERAHRRKRWYVGAILSLFRFSIHGFVGGAAQVLVGQPLDTVKTRAQIAPSEYHPSFEPLFIEIIFCHSEGMFVSTIPEYKRHSKV